MGLDIGMPCFHGIFGYTLFSIVPMLLVVSVPQTHSGINSQRGSGLKLHVLLGRANMIC